MVLLASKLRVPLPPKRAVDRARLVDALDRAITDAKLVLISAPAGYGKTTLVSQWAHADHLPVAWLSIGEEDDDVVHFLRYLLAAWDERRPGVGNSRAGLLLGETSPDVEAVLAAFVNVAHDVQGDLGGEIVFVLDDYHLAADPRIDEVLAFLLDHLPPAFHFVLLTREEPALPLARYRARGELADLRAADLAFDIHESRAFLNGTMAVDWADDEVMSVQAQVEGWIAGLQLVALAGQNGLAARRGGAVTGRQRFIADYFVQDVLAPLPDDQRRFLLGTSILGRLSGAVCDAVTGGRDGQEMLETLERSNLFLMPLDDTRTWFRYHRLFADLLREELYRRDTEWVGELHRRAAGWFLEQDRPEEAFDHAVRSQDAELVMDILERYFSAKLLGGEIRVVQRWLDAIPKAWHRRYPLIALVRAGVLLTTGRFETSTRTLDQVERDLAPEESGEIGPERARVTALRCYIACFQNDLARAEALADRALRALPEEDVAFRPGVYGALGDTYRRHGRWREARACYLKLLDFSHAPAFRVEAVHVLGALADLELRQGRLTDAARYWERALEAIEERERAGRLPLPAAGWVHIRLAEILYEWNELGEARRHLSEGLERAEIGGDVRALLAGRVIFGWLALAEGDAETATRSLKQAGALLETAQFAHWARQLDRFQLRVWLAQGELQTAGRWAEAVLAETKSEGLAQSAVARLAVARTLIARGDASSVETAVALLEWCVDAAEEEGRVGVQIEALALQALVFWKRGERPAAVVVLERALRLAEPEGYVRLFTDLGLPIARLLQAARARDVMPGYVKKLLGAFEEEAAPTQVGRYGLSEPLTPREHQVLQLLVVGLTNREIAESLVVAPGTVKKHAANIYGKLGVHGRTEAAARARALDLLD